MKSKDLSKQKYFIHTIKNNLIQSSQKLLNKDFAEKH